MIAAAGWLVWYKEGLGAAFITWVAALGLNAAWSWPFFGRQWNGRALVDILALLAAIAIFIAMTWTPARTAAMLLVPYLLRVAFASGQNLEIWQLNR